VATAEALMELEKSRQGNRPGIWEGRVESVDDPDRQDRVRVRIFMIHGDARQTPIEALPWADVSEIGGGGYDYGSAGRLYPVGSDVWVMFRHGDDGFPVVMGGRRGAAVARDDKNAFEYNTVGGKDESTTERPWSPPEGNEIVTDIFADAANEDRHPTRAVWNKSFKGHTILVEDRDEYEFLRIIDRAGQVIEMNCPVTSNANENNAAQRGARSAVDDNQLGQSQLVNGRAFIRLRDVAGQEIVLDGGSANEEIRIVSRNRQGTSIQQMTFSSRKGREKIEIKDKQGNTFLIDPNDPTPIQIYDYAGNRLEFDAENGIAKLISANKIEESVGSSKVSNVGGNSESEVGGDDKSKVLGNKVLDILNDLSASVAGLTQAVLTGPLNVTISNTQMSGDVEDYGAKLEVSLGGVDINSLATGNGTMHFGTLAGDVNVDTEAGNVTVSTTAGDLTAETVSGNATLGTQAGTTSVNGSSVAIGSSASFSATKGEIVQQIVNQINTALQTDQRVGFAGVPVPPSPAQLGIASALVTVIQQMLSTTVTVQP